MADPAARAKTLQRRLEQLVDATWPSGPLPATARLAYLAVAARGDWHGVVAAAKQQRAAARTALAELTPLQERTGALAADLDSGLADLVASWTRPDSRDDWPQVRAQLIATLAPQTGGPKATTLADTVGATTARAFAASLDRPLADLRGFIADSSQEWRAVLVGAGLAEAIAFLNTRRATPLPADLDDVVSAARGEVTTRLTRSRDTLHSGDPAEVRADAEALASWARGDALRAVVGLAADLSVVRRREPASRWTLGPAAEAVGELVRDLVLAHAIGLTVASAAVAGEDALEPWRALGRHPLADDLGPGRHVGIARLAADPQSHDGVEVKVSGVAGKVVIEHVHRKVLSTIDLLDQDGRSLRVGLEHIKLDSGGLVEGAYATVAGTFVASDPVFGGPTLRISRHSYETESAHSFVAGATHLTRRVFTPVAHGLRYACSWERGLSGANNQLRYGTWLPFERSL